MADKFTSPRSAGPSFMADSGPFSGSRGSVALEVTEDNFDQEQRDEIAALRRELQVTREQAAIAREREEVATQRAAELAKANAAIRSTLDLMTSIPALDDLLGQVMISINEHLGSPGSTLWFSDATQSQLHLTCLDGVIYGEPPERGGYIPQRAIMRHEATDADRDAMLMGRYHFLSDAWQRPDLEDPTRSWMRATGAMGLLVVPLQVAGKIIANLCVHKPDNLPFPEEKVELAVALVQQASLAIHVTRLASSEKEAAIAREQEEAATRRAEVLARANAAMAKTVGRLVEQPDIRNFVGEVLRVFATEFDAVGVEFWRYIDPATMFSPTLSYERATGRLHGEENEWRRMDAHRSERINHGTGRTLAGRIGRMTIEDFEARPEFVPFREKLREQDIQTILSVPMFIREECFGVICMRLDHDRILNNSEEELAFALAQQLALALQLTRLAEEAEQAVIAREQEEAATRRAEVLARANVAMAKTVGRLVEQPDIRNFVGEVLRVFAMEFGSIGAEFWEFDQEEQKFDPILSFDVATGEVAGEENDWQKFSRTTRPSDRSGERAIRAHRINYTHAEEIRTSPVFVPFVEKLLAQSVLTIAGVPVFLKDECLGAVCLRMDHHRILNSAEEELAFALAQQLALALQLTSLAEEAKEAAVAREQEEAAQQRVAQLAKANQILRSTVDVMTSIPALDEFLGTVMVAINESLGARASTLWELDYVAKRGRLAMTAIDGAWSKEPVPMDGAVLASEFPFDPNIEVLADFKKPRFTPDIQNHVNVDEKTRAWLQHMEAAALQELPIVVGGSAVAVLSIHCERNEPFPAEKLELALVLAQQLGLSMHITRLAEEAKQTAIAREQEEAATQRAAELAKANAALKTSIGALAKDQEIDGFLGQVLRSITDQIGSPSSTLWLFDRLNFNRAALHLVYAAGSLSQGSGHPLQSNRVFHDNTLNEGHQRVLRGEQFVMQVATYDGFSPGQREYLQALGIATLLSSPMMIGDRALGAFVLHFLEERSFQPQELELVRALSDQAALALELTHRADEAKQAAIAREREEEAARRAEVLARANAAMAKTVGRLVEQPDIRNFVGEVLSVFANEFNALGVEYWEFLAETGWFSPSLSFDRATGLLEGETNEWRRLDRLRTASSPASEIVSTLAGRITRSTVEDFETRADLLPFREKLREQGVRTILGVPMFIKDECFGVICMRHTEDRVLTSSEEELAFALAQQLALALQLTRLAEEAKQAAIAREQEEAAQQRVAQLVKANEILRSTVNKMTSIPALDEFLGAVMLAINESLGARGSTFWMLDPEKQRSELTMTTIEGQWSPTPPVYDGSTLVSGYALPPEYIEQRQGNGRWLFTPNIREHSLIDDGTRNWLKHLGVVALHEFAIVVGRKTIGTLVIHSEANEPFPAEKLELAVVLAQQLGLAIHITRLAEEVKQAAIAREQEEAATQKAAVLARANVVMAKTIGRLVEDPGIRNFTGQVLDVFATEFDAIGVEFWSYDAAADWFTPILSFDRATGELTGEDNVWSKLNGRRQARNASADAAAIAGRIVRLSQNDIEEMPSLAAFRDKLQSQGVLTILCVPLQVKNEHMGTVCMRFRIDRTFNAAEEELAFALAQQLALALQLSRLADEAQQAAVLREQERAATIQAAELAKANSAISSSLAKLAAYPDVEGFLGQILLSITNHLGEQDGGVWLYDQALDRLILRLSLEDGVLVKDGFHVHAKWLVFEDSDEASEGVTPKAHGLRNRVTIHTLEEIRTSPVWEPYRDTIKQGGFQCTMEVPMFVGDELIGFYAIRAKHHQTFSASEIELAQALAHQAALACHVRRLAEQTAESAQQTAIAEERNRLARDIHDTLAQGFAAIAMQLQGATRERASLPRAVRPYLERAIELTRENLAEARKSVGALRSHESPSGGFLPTLTRLIEEARKRSSALIELKLDCQSLSIPRNVEDELLRIAQEALNNATKHSSAERIVIDVTAAGDGLRLKIQDNGTGFNADTPTAGYGLGIMQERAKRVGATWTLITEPDNGTEVIAVWSPKPETSEKND